MYFQPLCSFPETGLFRPVRVDPRGVEGPTRRQARSDDWVMVGRSRYVPAWVDRSVPEQRAVEEAVRLPSGAALTGWASLRLAGAGFFDGLVWASGSRPRQLPVQVAVGPASNLAPCGAKVSREPLAATEVVTRHGMPCTRVPRALFDEMRECEDWREAVVAMDMAAAARLVTVERLATYAGARTRWRRSSLVTRALPWCSAGSMSPNETRIRLVWEVDAGLPRPLVNRDVFDLRGRHICRADLFDPVAGVVGEYDGAAHRAAGRHSRDVAREERCRRNGLEYFKVTGPDLQDRDLVARRMLSTRNRALATPGARRTWTLDGPPWF